MASYGICRQCGGQTIGGATLCGFCAQKSTRESRVANNIPSIIVRDIRLPVFGAHDEDDAFEMSHSSSSSNYSHRSYGMLPQPSQLSPADIPDFITGQMDAIKRLNQNAARARQTQERAEDSAQYALREAESARERAKQAAELSAGIGKKKAAIEALQQTVVSMSDALNETTQAQEDAMEAQIQLSEVQQSIIEYQEKVTEVSQYLFQMGALSIAQNRAVVRELELRLRGASEEELGDLAQQELKAVFLQLKQQLDLIERIDRLEEKHRELRSKYDELSKTAAVVSSLTTSHTSLIQRVYQLELSHKDASKKTEPTPSDVILPKPQEAKVTLSDQVEQTNPVKESVPAPTTKNYSGVALVIAALAFIVSSAILIMQFI